MNKNILTEAQMHIEYAMEALSDIKYSIEPLFRCDGQEHLRDNWDEVNARIEAISFLIQNAISGKKPEGMEIVMSKANFYNGAEEGFDEFMGKLVKF